jgi:hypothetical protein
MKNSSAAETHFVPSHDPASAVNSSSHTLQNRPAGDKLERRSSRRYAIDAALNLSVGPAKRPTIVGEGRLINISRTGALIAWPQSLPVSEIVVLSIEWPVRPDPHSPIYMRIVAKIRRRQDDLTALEILRCQFPCTK